MTYTDLIKTIAEECNCTQTLVKQIVICLAGNITEQAKQGQMIRIPELGTFSRSERTERLARNPATGEPVVVPRKVTVKFRAGKLLQEKMNK